MKKLLLILVLMLATSLPALAINPYLQGDINDDGVVDIWDLTELIDALLSGDNAEFDGYDDVNSDGKADVWDVTDLIDILLGNLPENENTVSVSIPEEAPITVDDVVVVGYGIEIEPSTNPRHLREAGKRYYVTDANAISVFTRDGKPVYDCYVSLDINNSERSVAVDALETAYSLLVPLFPHVFDATSDCVYDELKRMLSALPETQALAAAIDNSIVRHGYFEIDDVLTEYQAAVDKVIDKLGLRDNFLSDAAGSHASFKDPSEPSVPYGEYGHWGMKLRLNSSIWTPASGGGSWTCNMTAYNSNRFAYTSWVRGYKDEQGNVYPYSFSPEYLLDNILKPQRVSTFMNVFTDPVTDPLSSKSWEHAWNFISDSWNLLFDPEFQLNDMTWDMTKVKFDMEFDSPYDVVIFCGPDQDVILLYNVLRSIIEPFIKKICKNINKASKAGSEPDFFAVLTWELLKDAGYWEQFSATLSSNKSNGQKFKELFELTSPKAKTILINYAEQRMVEWTTDMSKEVFGYATIEQMEKAYSDATKNMTALLKIIEFWGDMGLGLAGIFYEGSGYYDMDLDFNDVPIITKEFTVGDVTFSMVEVKGGSFLMGASMEQINAAHDDEYPLHNVTLSDYYIGQTEVTQELWEAVMGSVPGSHKNAKYPVGGVSWLECQQFISKLNEMTGENFRLPTEAEWEFAARGGSGAKARLYSGSDNLGNVAWYSGNATSPHAVATKYPNQLALYDMSGNAMEWCSDWYGAYGNDAQTNPTGPAEGTMRVCRGGGWGYGSDLCRVSCRNSFAPSNSMNENLGLRLVWVPKTSDETFTVNGVTFKMVHVESGTFMMGGTSEQGSDVWSDREYPVHQVTLSSFNIGQTEVTQALWQAVMGSNPSYFSGDSNRPVERVSWNDCQNFLNKLNELTGMAFRLPTEAEWEFAARGGNKSQGNKYAGSSDIDFVAWYKHNSNDMTHPVATKAPNELGIYDMSGNVSEWCYDWYGKYNSGEQINPTGPSTGQWRVCRGGDWNSDSSHQRVSCRHYNYASHSWEHDGLRLALDDSTPSIDEYEYVDLGLPSGTLWATCNVGADSPEDYGDYFAWGETAPKEFYGWETYKWCNGSWNSMTKYCTDSYYGTIDNIRELEPVDDAAYVNWGPSWRMPSQEQYQELENNCTWQWTTHNGVNGRLVTGPNGNTIFLPAAGDRWGSSFYGAGSDGYYWSRTLDSSNPEFASTFSFYSGNWGYWNDGSRDDGFTVRAVRVP